MPIYTVYVRGSYTTEESHTFDDIEAKDEEEAKDKAAEALCDYYGEDFDDIDCDIEDEHPSEEEVDAAKLAKGLTPRCKYTEDMFA